MPPLAHRHHPVPAIAFSTVGRDEEVIRKYIRAQDAEDKRLDRRSLWR
jgi:hypothetical protein